MDIIKISGYQTIDGKISETKELAEIHNKKLESEIKDRLVCFKDDLGHFDFNDSGVFANKVFENREWVLSILNANPY